MKRVRGFLINGLFAIVILIFCAFLPILTKVNAEGNILLSQIYCGSVNSASEEYISLVNIGNTTIDINNWKIEYFSASPKDFISPTRSIKLSGSISAGSDFVIATANNSITSSDLIFSSTLAASGGHIKLSNNLGQEIDFVGWGTASKPKGSAVASPKPGEIISRKQDQNGQYINRGENSADFEIITGTETNIENRSLESSFLPLEISEILPNPASPVSDATGEFVELYNPNSVDINLVGYKLLSGSTLNHTFVFKDQIIKANSYLAFYISETKLTLSNANGKVQLVDNSGKVLSETAEYVNAPEGSSWIRIDSSWVWTKQITPNAENILEQPEPKEETSSATKSNSKAKATKATTKAKAAKTDKDPKTGNVLASETTIPAKSTLNAGILAGVGGLALLYGGYEYRQDIINFYHKLRRNRKAR